MKVTDTPRRIVDAAITGYQRHISPRNSFNPYRGRRHRVFFAVVLRTCPKGKQKKKQERRQGILGWFHGIPRKIDIADIRPLRAREKMKQGVSAVKKIVSHAPNNLRLPPFLR